VPVHRGWRISRAFGRDGIDSVRIEPTDRMATAGSPIGASGKTVRPGDRLDCDLLAVHGGWTPALQLARQAAGTCSADGSEDWVCVVGAARGHDQPESCMGDGWHRAIGLLGKMTRGPTSGASSGATARPERIAPAAAPPILALPGPIPEGLAAQRVFIDCASDVTALDIALAQREGYEAPELLKRYTTLGMGPDQGRGTGPLGIELLARHRGLAPGHLEPTRARPPFVPVAFGTLAGADPGPLIRPYRDTPLSAWHREAGAVMYESGANWRRPGYYPRVGESLDQALRRECRAVRQAVGLYDSTPLAKYEISGPQAEAFLERLLPSRVGTLKPGRGRYALMLREDGRLLDDGVIFRLASDRFWLTGTAGNAEAVQAWLDYARQWLFRDLRQVIVAPVSAQWATIVVCGPKARALITKLGTDLDLDAAAFPFMAMRAGRVAGCDARVFRVSFTGELSYELNVRPRDALALWLQLLDGGRDLGIEPIGSEANHVLRVEKGFVSIGHEADGFANPDDLGLGWAVHIDKGDFVGRRSILRDRAPALPRPELVGLEVDDGPALEEGAQIVDAAARLGHETGPDAARSQGFVTASVESAALERPIALALLERGRARIGEIVQVTVAPPDASERGHAGLSLRRATVVAPVFYDPEGVRLRG
jgi:sarcosine oxidase subunit alpha